MDDAQLPVAVKPGSNRNMPVCVYNALISKCFSPMLPIFSQIHDKFTGEYRYLVCLLLSIGSLHLQLRLLSI